MIFFFSTNRLKKLIIAEISYLCCCGMDPDKGIELFLGDGHLDGEPKAEDNLASLRTQVVEANHTLLLTINNHPQLFGDTNVTDQNQDLASLGTQVVEAHHTLLLTINKHPQLFIDTKVTDQNQDLASLGTQVVEANHTLLLTINLPSSTVYRYERN
jgi:PHD/YefM family antitoxin component YafN of YafNO toxin-antitoxin module